MDIKSLYRNILKYYQKTLKGRKGLILLIMALIFSCTLTIVDFYNSPTTLLFSVPYGLRMVIAVVGVLCVFLLIIYKRFWKVLNVKMPLDIDKLMVCVIFSAYLYLIEVIALGLISLFKTIGVCAVVLVICELQIIRTHAIYKDNNAVTKKASNLFDLKDIYEGTFDYSGDGPILLSEHDADYDILKRSFVINLLVSSIYSCCNDRSYVIALEGAWGSGKTTIINNTIANIQQGERSKEFIIIDSFEPWIYGSQEAMITSIYDTILRNLGYSINSASRRAVINAIIETTSDSSKAAKVVSRLICSIGDPSERVEKMKGNIGEYLETTNKKILFFIDNIDRIENKQIIFLLKLISVIFDIPNTIYILSFDALRINNAFQHTDEMDEHYIEKIVQQEIKVPAIDSEILEDIFSKCIINIFRAHRIDDNTIESCFPVIKSIVPLLRNLRNVKRFLNTVVSIVVSNKEVLFLGDLLAIEAIHFLSPELYEIIRSNRRFLISIETTIFDHNYSLNKDEFAKDQKLFYQMLMDRYSLYMDILSIMFPNVYNANSERVGLVLLGYKRPNDTIMKSQARICSSLFFDLYFSHCSNCYSIIESSVREFVMEVNHSNDNTEQIASSIISSLPQTHHKVWFERLQLHIDDIDLSAIPAVISSLCRNFSVIDNEAQFMDYSADMRACIIIAILLNKCEQADLKKILTRELTEYRCVGLWDVVLSAYKKLGSSLTISVVDDPERSEQIENAFSSLCSEIIAKRINLYDEIYYHKRNIWALCRYVERTGKIQQLQEYMNDICSPKYVYKLVWDMSSFSHGSEGYRYYISKKNIESLQIDKDFIEQMLVANPPSTRDEEILATIFREHLLDDSHGYMGDKSYLMKTEFSPNI